LLEVLVARHTEYERQQREGECSRYVEQHSPDELFARDQWMCFGLVHESSTD
jgi:hypothetical protein